MVTYRVSNKSDLTEGEKLNIINDCSVGELLKVLREFEDKPRNFSPEIMKLVGKRLYDNGIMCM